MDIFSYHEIITTRNLTCKKCLSIVYTIPTETTKTLAKYMDTFGEPLYPLNQTNLLKIKSKDQYEIETRLGSTSIKLKLPKKFEGVDLSKTRKPEFEEALVRWLEKTLKIKIKGKGEK